MPCGWFHEVRSYGNSKEGGHLALNYWFHPPDNLDTSPDGMQKPYRYSPQVHQCCPAHMMLLVRLLEQCWCGAV